MLNSSYKLKNSQLKEVRVVADLTKAQRETEREMERTCEDRNVHLTAEEAKNYVWKVVGPKGQKRLAKVPIENAGKRSRDEVSPQNNARRSRLRSSQH